MAYQVLIVEDEQLLLRAMTKVLSQSGAFEVAAVESLETARDCLEHMRPDLVICDLALPGGDGLGVIDVLRGHGLAIPIVALSADAEMFRERLAHDDRIHIVDKPLKPRELRELVEHKLLPQVCASDTAFGVVDYLQMAQYAGRSLRLEVSCQGAAGHITLWRGEPWSARLGRRCGREALSTMIAAKARVSRAHMISQPPSSRSFEVCVDALLLELARDEDERGAAASPPDQEAGATPQRPRFDDCLTEFVRSLAHGEMPQAVACLAEAREISSGDVRTTSWWCDAFFKRWELRSDRSHGGAA